MVSKQVQQQIIQFQNLQQQLQVLLMQKQRLDMDKRIFEGAMQELEKAKGKVYKAIGPILVESTQEDVKTDLTKSVGDISTRIDSLNQHELKLKSRLTELESELRSATESGDEGGSSTTVSEAS